MALFSSEEVAFHLDLREANPGNLGLVFVHGKSGECVYFWLSVKSLQMQRPLLVWACEASSGMHLAEPGLPGGLQQRLQRHRDFLLPRPRRWQSSCDFPTACLVTKPTVFLSQVPSCYVGLGSRMRLVEEKQECYGVLLPAVVTEAVASDAVKGGSPFFTEPSTFPKRLSLSTYGSWLRWWGGVVSHIGSLAYQIFTL